MPKARKPIKLHLLDRPHKRWDANVYAKSEDGKVYVGRQKVRPRTPERLIWKRYPKAKLPTGLDNWTTGETIVVTPVPQKRSTGEEIPE